MAPEPTDAALLRGDGADYEAFYRRHVVVVHAYVNRRVRRADVTLDLVAETFARALAARRRYDPARGPAAAWLLGIARNLIIDAARRGRVADATRQRLALERLELDDHAADATDPAFDEAALTAALADLPDEQRTAILARIVDEEPYAVIAQRLGCSEQVVRKRVSRGLAAARTALEERA
ncbi:MAG: RNA polymerase sigma factor [Patulibacter minatonensis]